MKIAFFSDGIQPFVVGGIQRHSFYFCKFISKLGVEIDLYHTTFDGIKPDLANVFSEDELKYINDIYIPFPKHIKLPGHYVRESYELSKTMFKKFRERNNNVDFVYSKNYSSWYYIKQKKSGMNLPPIGVMLHGYEAYQINRKSLVARKNVFFHKQPTDYNSFEADFVFSYGGKITDIIENNIGVPKERIIEIPSGIDSQWTNINSKERSNEKLVFAFVGRYTPRKGINLIYNWIQKNITLDFEINFVGPFPENDKISNPKIIYHGKVTESDKLQNILDNSDILLCPSRAEGMPNVILEGMARGCAILATDVGAVAALVNQDNGWLIPPFDQKRFDDTMTDIFKTDRNEIKRKGIKSNQRVKDSFTWERIALRKLEEIQKIVRNSKVN